MFARDLQSQSNEMRSAEDDLRHMDALPIGLHDNVREINMYAGSATNAAKELTAQRSRRFSL
jgi:hypothetical protein